MGFPNYSFNNLRLKLSNSDYYDVYLSSDDVHPVIYNGIFTGTSLITYFDFTNNNIYSTGSTSANTIYSLTTWNDAVNSGVTIYDIGLVGIDNGLITYEPISGDTTNSALVSALTESTLVLPSGDTRFWMHAVTGMTGNYIYPITMSSDSSGQYAQLCGGFYQGFYKLHEYDYDVLPNRFHKGWAAEFWLNKSDNNCSGFTGTTLNDIYPDNKGFFFFIGARAENKFWNVFTGNNLSISACTSGCSEWCTIPKENQMTTTNGWPLDPPKIFSYDTDNKFVFFNRSSGSGSSMCTCSAGPADDSNTNGYSVCNFTGDSLTITSTTVYTDYDNQFTAYSESNGRSYCSCTTGGTPGFRAFNYTGRTTQIMELDKDADVVDNAIGFRIKDDGSIGYRKLTYTCLTESVTAATIEEFYSYSGMVQDNEWTHVAIRFISDRTLCGFLPTDKPRSGQLLFYINGKLKFIVNNFTELIPKAMDEHMDKQQGVPYNISIGGGSQGLIDNQTFDGPDASDTGLLIETNFAGTFAGRLSKFRLYDEVLSYDIINNNYKAEAAQYGHILPCPCGCQ
jgi:hypothetical protein